MMYFTIVSWYCVMPMAIPTEERPVSICVKTADVVWTRNVYSSCLPIMDEKWRQMSDGACGDGWIVAQFTVIQFLTRSHGSGFRILCCIVA